MDQVVESGNLNLILQWMGMRGRGEDIVPCGLGTVQTERVTLCCCPSFSEEERLLPYVFRWDGGGSEVYLSGTFNDWETDNIMMATNR